MLVCDNKRAVQRNHDLRKEMAANTPVLDERLKFAFKQKCNVELVIQTKVTLLIDTGT